MGSRTLAEPRQLCPPGALTTPTQGCPPAPRGPSGWVGSVSVSPAERPGSRQAETASSPPRRGSAGPLSVCQERSCSAGLPRRHLISGSLPSQLDEEEERRKRRREKNKVAAARCRNKKKERTEFLQRVSRAAGQGGSGLALKDLIKAVGSLCTWASTPAASAPLLFPDSF